MNSRKKPCEVAVSAFGADLADIKTDLRRAADAGAGAVHIDVMDGHFVPTLGMGIQWAEAASRHVGLPMDVHLMTLHPQRFAQPFLALSVRTLLFHLEASDPQTAWDLLCQIKKQGIRCGLAVAPDSQLQLLLSFLPLIDEVLLMTSYPGQPLARYLTGSPDRVAALQKLLSASAGRVDIAVDGGLNPDSALDCVNAGASKVIMGRAFFSSPHPESIVRALCPKK